jgi:high frequency lysogenization protein
MSRSVNRNLRSRTIALAGLFQAVWLVRQTARGQLRDPDATRACIRSIFATDAASVTAVFGGIRSLSTGLEAMIAQLDAAAGGRDLELTGHVINLLSLARQLNRDRTMSEQIAAGLRQLARPADDADADDPALTGALATLYQQTISTLSPRVLVHGEQSLLENRATQNRLRSLLLAGIRAAVLWHQCGGSRWRLLVERGRMLACARSLLQEIRTGTG